MKSCSRFLVLGLAICVGCNGTARDGRAQGNKTYRERPISIIHDGWRLYGTLTTPLKEEASIVALLLPGAGPTDRNGNSGATVAPATLRKLAIALASEGVASVRYDKRGVGESRDKILHEEQLRFSHYVEDAVAWIKKLKNMARFQRVVVIGHGEGALVGAMASTMEPPDACVSLCGPGRPADILLREQLALNPLNKPWLTRCSTIIDSIKAGYRPSNIPPALHGPFRASIQPYLESLFAISPPKVFNLLHIPILIIGGSSDIQVQKVDFDSLCARVKQANCVYLEGMNHVLVESTPDYASNVATYLDPQKPLSRELVESIVKFVRKLN
ncbi:MAG: lysophospholipase [Flavobacteriales bacterium]|nr:lysophospholipase [Flavobacteriales bacterium]